LEFQRSSTIQGGSIELNKTVLIELSGRQLDSRISRSYVNTGNLLGAAARSISLDETIMSPIGSKIFIQGVH
jgi:hypothetical protein